MADPSSRTGSSYDDDRIRELVDGLYHPETEGMRAAVGEIEAEGLSAIQIGRGDGAILALLLGLVGARRAVEIGTLAGYSALWLLEGMPADGRLWTCEADPVAAAAARRVFVRAGVADRVEIVGGEALETLPSIEEHGPFDAVFIDADKRGYPAYLDWALDHLRSGGLVLADNAFLFGRLADEQGSPRASADEIRAMREFHRRLAARCDPATVIPTPDGLAVGIKR